MIDYNSYLVNELLNEISGNILRTIKEKERNYKDVSFYVPMGVITNNPLFVNKGPKIPVRMETIGSVLSGIRTNVKDYGINNSLIEMTIHVEVTERIIPPVMTNELKIENDIPISYKIIKGKVPNYYGDSISKNSSVFTFPVE